jgi:hypothetical protein
LLVVCTACVISRLSIDRSTGGGATSTTLGRYVVFVSAAVASIVFWLGVAEVVTARAAANWLWRAAAVGASR